MRSAAREAVESWEEIRDERNGPQYAIASWLTLALGAYLTALERGVEVQPMEIAKWLTRALAWTAAELAASEDEPQPLLGALREDAVPRSRSRRDLLLVDESAEQVPALLGDRVLAPTPDSHRLSSAHLLDRQARELVITRRNQPRAVLITVERYQQLLHASADSTA